MTITEAYAAYRKATPEKIILNSSAMIQSFVVWGKMPRRQNYHRRRSRMKTAPLRGESYTLVFLGVNIVNANYRDYESRRCEQPIERAVRRYSLGDRSDIARGMRAAACDTEMPGADLSVASMVQRWLARGRLQ